jgi:hypothetical protein
LLNAMHSWWTREKGKVRTLYNELESRLLNYEMEQIDRNIGRGSLWYHLIEIEDKNTDWRVSRLEDELKILRAADNSEDNTKNPPPKDDDDDDDDES